MVRGTSTMGIAGPALVAAATGERTDKDTLGGADAQAMRHGLADLVADSDSHALALARRYLAYLPGNADAEPPRPPWPQPQAEPDAQDEQALLHIVPDNPRQPYDVHRVLRAIADRDSLFELKPDFAPNLVTAFARLGGRPVGIVANQPLHLAGTLDARACEKGAHFVSVCDAFGLALVYLIDLPGFLVGPAAAPMAAC